MPSIDHEAILELFRARPVLATELMAEALGVPLPPYTEVVVGESDFTQITPVPYRADLALLLRDGAHNRCGLIVEAQLERDEDKLLTWPYYAIAGRLRWRCETTVLVVTPYAGVARWAASRLPIGGGNTYAPTVVGPQQVPEVVDFDVAAARPELAVLSAMAHGRRPIGGRIALAAAQAAQRLDTGTGAFYYDLVLSSLSRAAREVLEAMMRSGRYEYRSDFARKYFQEGRDEGRDEGRKEGRDEGRDEGRVEALRGVVLKQLRLKFRRLPRAIAQRVASAPAAELERWSERVLFASTLDEVFGE